VRGLPFSSPLNTHFDVLAGWHVAGLELGVMLLHHSSDVKYLHGEEGFPQWKKPDLHVPSNSIKCHLEVGGPHPQLIRLKKTSPSLH
jgi:hypothetical protein